MAALDRPDPPRLWIVTRGAQAVSPGDPVAIAAAPLWGLAGVIAAEHPALRCAIADVGRWDDPEEMGALAGAMRNGDPSCRIALRGRTRFVERTAALPPEGARAESALGGGRGPRRSAPRRGRRER